MKISQHRPSTIVPTLSITTLMVTASRGRWMRRKGKLTTYVYTAI
jgi:hypothetical protein